MENGKGEGKQNIKRGRKLMGYIRGPEKETDIQLSREKRKKHCVRKKRKQTDMSPCYLDRKYAT